MAASCCFGGLSYNFFILFYRGERAVIELDVYDYTHGLTFLSFRDLFLRRENTLLG